MDLSNPQVLKSLLSRHGFHFSHKLGQNFLVNPTVCPRMAEACGAAPGVGVLEIGPGVGVLTAALAERAEKVAAVELDRRLLPVLEETLSAFSNVHVIPGDAMEMDLKALLREEFPGLRAAVCANLPYYLTSPILMKLLSARLPVESITVMVQKEAAERLCAAPGQRACGAVSAAVSYYAEPRVLFPVGRGSFLPQPNVDSAVISLRVREKPAVAVKDEAFFFRVVKACFGKRRKTCENALSSGLSVPKAAAAAALERAGVPKTARAEALTLSQFAALADALYGVQSA